jgi:hypothetical protein
MSETVVQFKRRNNTTAELIVRARKLMYDATHYKAQSHKARVEAGQTLLELRQRVERGDEGPDQKWWSWFDANVDGNRSYAEKLLKIAGAPDQEAQEAEAERQAKRNREAVQKHRATSYVRGEQHKEDKENGSDLVEYVWSLIKQLTAEQRKQIMERLNDYD